MLVLVELQVPVAPVDRPLAGGLRIAEPSDGEPRRHRATLKWCDSIWPKHMWDQARVEADVAPTYVTIVEVRPDWI